MPVALKCYAGAWHGGGLLLLEISGLMANQANHFSYTFMREHNRLADEIKVDSIVVLTRCFLPCGIRRFLR